MFLCRSDMVTGRKCAFRGIGISGGHFLVRDLEMKIAK